MALTEKHKKWRRDGIGGSDARTIARGSREAWTLLKNEKLFGVEPEFEKQQKLLMALGTVVEPVILDYVHEHVTKVGERNIPVTMPADPYFRCTLDGLTAIGQPIQCKFHTGDRNIDDMAEYYWPQLQHELMVTGEKVLVLAVVFGHWGRFDHLLVEQDFKFQSEYMLRALQFKEWCWGTGKLPEDLAQGTEAPIAQNIPRLRDHVWAEGDNEVANFALAWIEHRGNVEIFKSAETALKKAMPEDARSATWVRNGSGIRITTNKAGAKSIKPHVGSA